MKRFLSVFILLVSFTFAYNVGETVSLSDQQLTKEVCYGHTLNTGDDFSLYDLNGAYNGGEYHVIFLDLSASW